MQVQPLSPRLIRTRAITLDQLLLARLQIRHLTPFAWSLTSVINHYQQHLRKPFKAACPSTGSAPTSATTNH